MTKKWPKYVKLFLAYVLLTFGITVEYKAKFYTKSFQNRDSSEFDIYLKVGEEVKILYAPLVFWVSYNKAPYGMDFLLKTKDNSVNGVVINHVKMTTGGAVKEVFVNKKCEVSSSESTYYDFSGYHFGKTAKAKLPRIIMGEKVTKIDIGYTVYFNDQSFRCFDSEWVVESRRELKLSTALMQLIRGVYSSQAA